MGDQVKKGSMSEKYDVVIIGGGIIGVCAAYFLAKEGAQVALLEKGEICAGSSHGNAGLICPSLCNPIPAPGVMWQGIKWMADPASPFYIKPRLDSDLIRWLWRFRSFCNTEAVHRAIPFLREMQRSSLNLYREIIAAEAIECHFKQIGGMSLYLSEEKFGVGRKSAAESADYGLVNDILSGDGARELDPAIHPDVIGAIFHTEDGHFNPGLFVRNLAKRLPASKATIFANRAVNGITVDNGRVSHVQTDSGEIQLDQLVLAAGIYSTKLARQIGVDIPMQAAKGYSITMRGAENMPAYHYHLGEAKCAVTPMGDELRFAGTLELSGINQEINQRRVAAIWNGARRYFIDPGEPQIVETWSGLRPTPPDGLPYLGRSSRIKNMAVATGHAMLGMSMGPATGKAVAELVCRQSSSIDISAFSVDRF